MTRHIGLDVHRDYIHGCEWIPHEAREKHFRLKNNRDAWANLAKMLGPDCEVAVEVTGNAFELYDVLSPHCARMVLANPSALKRFGSGQHTDRVDAVRLAKMMVMNAAPAVCVPGSLNNRPDATSGGNCRMRSNAHIVPLALALRSVERPDRSPSLFGDHRV